MEMRAGRGEVWRRLMRGAMVLVMLGTCGAWGREGPEILGTVGMVTDLAREVTGEAGAVRGLIGEGVDPHLYKPTRKDLVRLRQADIILYNGLKLEGRLADILEEMGRNGRSVRALSEAVLAGGRYRGKGGEEGTDPHLWMDVGAWRLALKEVVTFLGEADRERADRYRENGRAYTEELDRLDGYAREVLGSIPEEHRILVTAHDAFGYFGRAYGLEVRGIQGLSTESEAGLRDLEELLSEIVERGIPAIFVESSVSDKNVRALVEGARSKGHDLEIGGTLYSDAMGPAGTYRGTYFGMLDHNITTIARALGGRAPEGGIDGKLVEQGN